MGKPMNKSNIGFLVFLLVLGILVGLAMPSIFPSHQVQRLSAQSVDYICPPPSGNESFTLQLTPASNPRWYLLSCVYLPPDMSGGQTTINVTTEDANGAVLSGIPVTQYWPDGSVTQFTSGGFTQFAMGPSSCDPPTRPGALSIYVGGGISQSDVITGMCLPVNRHVVFMLTFRQVSGPTTPTVTPKPGTPTITPVPGNYVTHEELPGLIKEYLQELLK
jgi:hypothetical protein